MLLKIILIICMELIFIFLKMNKPLKFNWKVYKRGIIEGRDSNDNSNRSGYRDKKNIKETIKEKHQLLGGDEDPSS